MDILTCQIADLHAGVTLVAPSVKLYRNGVVTKRPQVGVATVIFKKASSVAFRPSAVSRFALG